MKKLIVLILFILLSSCKYAKQSTYSDEYIIANYTLNHYTNIPILRLLQKPQNLMVEDYKDGIYDDSSKFHKIGFSLRTNNTKKWTKKIAFNDKSLREKLRIIDDYSKIKKVDPLNSETFISLSNVIYSKDNNYAAITINIFHNTNVGDNTAEGYTFIYQKVNNTWEFVTKLTAYLT